jgi:class 3 adenylate cyclase
MTSRPKLDLIGDESRGRKLIAVVHADMVGYSRLIGLDDAGTLNRLRTLRRALILPAIREYGGDVVQTAGDSLLILFDSIEGAVRCTVKIQQEIPSYDDQPPDRAIRFRIGINIGDVISDGADYHGDGVNIAARLQAECPVGGICVSRSVRDHVHGRLNLKFKALGPLTLKNIRRPIEAFALRLDEGAEDHARFAREPEGAAPAPVEGRLLQAASTPLGVVTLTVLMIEIIIGILALLGGSSAAPELARLMAIVIVPFICTVAVLGWLRPQTLIGARPERPDEDPGGLIKVFDKANDFLATGDSSQFASLLGNARNEAWFIGTSFYISSVQYRDLILDKLADGVDLNFLILDPDGKAVPTASSLHGVTETEMRLDCMSGLRVLNRTLQEARMTGAPGALRIRLADEPFQIRLYFFDPRSPDGHLFFVPGLNGENTQTVPGFLVRNLASCAGVYFTGALKRWSHSGTRTLENWKAEHPGFE